MTTCNIGDHLCKSLHPHYNCWYFQISRSILIIFICIFKSLGTGHISFNRFQACAPLLLSSLCVCLISHVFRIFWRFLVVHWLWPSQRMYNGQVLTEPLSTLIHRYLQMKKDFFFFFQFLFFCFFVLIIFHHTMHTYLWHLVFFCCTFTMIPGVGFFYEGSLFSIFIVGNLFQLITLRGKI